jgi:Holliday junction resolvase
MAKDLSNGDDVSRSTRHKKITGDFGERMILYLLSKEGFECAYVDHTGIDIIARNRITDELMGISVKSRSRKLHNELEALNINVSDFEKVDNACKAFGCQPYFALVTHATRGTIYIIPLDILKQISNSGSKKLYWNMNQAKQESYKKNAETKWFTFQIERGNWWTKPRKIKDRKADASVEATNRN